MIRVYCRCNSGHYFAGDICPLDGWSSSECLELADCVDRLRASGTRPCLEQLRLVGASEEAIKRAIVIEFGSDSVVFDAIAPAGYVIENEWREIDKLGLEFM